MTKQILFIASDSFYNYLCYDNYAKRVGNILMPQKTKLLNIRIDAELKRSAKKIAVEDGRSLSNWVTRLIEKEVKNSGKT